MKKFFIVLTFIIFILNCTVTQKEETARGAIFIGIDVSASFYKSAYYQDAIKFISYYIYGHLQGISGLKKPKALFVSSIGGFSPDEPKSFRPINDFESKTREEIEMDLVNWLKPDQKITDFNVFFEHIATIVKKRNLVLAPINIIIVSDGEPSYFDKTQNTIRKMPIQKINVSPLEYLTRNITIRILYPTPVIADKWEKQIKRTRVRLWHVDCDVMKGWNVKLLPDKNANEQKELWKWILENVDFRVKRGVIL